MKNTEIRRSVLVPRYYDPEIDDLLLGLSASHDLVSIGTLIDEGLIELRQGKYIGKLHYGTGRIPYIRTSDIANWELRASPKHGVSEAVWNTYQKQQDVAPGDVLLVHEGTYLIGTSAPITRYDLPLLFQHHLAKLRPAEDAPFNGPLLCALLSAPIVQRQIRSKQLTADIIDSIVGRLQEVILPIPHDANARLQLAEQCAAVFDERAEARSRLSLLTRQLDEALREGDSAAVRTVQSAELHEGIPMALLGERIGFRAFRHVYSDLLDDVLIPAYYDPTIGADLKQMKAAGCELITIRELARAGVLSLNTGDEVGKLAYGSGEVPFIRTSDLGTWELKLDPKQRVSRAVFESLPSQSVQEEDILVVRDGTYLVGTAAIVSASDLPLLISGGIYRIRVEKPDELSPYLLLALLWSGIVRRQMRAKRFTRDVIDTLGRRIEEIVVPLPTGEMRTEISDVVRDLVELRGRLRDIAGALGIRVETGDNPLVRA